ncbi:MAG: hypothetical protein U1D30_25575 [Planctomycetota bacterium]
MAADTTYMMDELEELLLDAEEIVVNFRDRYGDYSVGHFEEDPEMSEYEEILDLGRILGSDRI